MDGVYFAETQHTQIYKCSDLGNVNRLRKMEEDHMKDYFCHVPVAAIIAKMSLPCTGYVTPNFEVQFGK